ncbi:hypothetical protein GCM10023075_51920 [Streptosporangium album]
MRPIAAAVPIGGTPMTRAGGDVDMLVKQGSATVLHRQADALRFIGRAFGNPLDGPAG